MKSFQEWQTFWDEILHRHHDHHDDNHHDHHDNHDHNHHDHHHHQDFSDSSATVTSLQAKVEGLATTNALMKVTITMVMVMVMMVMSQEDLSISRTSAEKIQAENKRLRYQN